MRRIAIATTLIATAAVPSPRSTAYIRPPPMNHTVEKRVLPALERLTGRLVRERRGMILGGARVFEAGDKFLPGKIAIGLAYPVLQARPGPARDGALADFRAIAALTVDDANESWGIYYYCLALYKLRRAGLLDRAVDPVTLATLRRNLDWRRFVRPDLTLIDLPNNYYGVAFSVARLRYLLGWEDESSAVALLARTLDHYRRYSGNYGFADETDGMGRFDRYSVLLIGEIAQRFIETGLTPPPEVLGWLRKSVDLMLPRLNVRGEGFEYGRSIGAYGDTAFLEVLSAAAKLHVLTPLETRMAYAFSARVAARYMGFWYDPATGSVNLWDGGRRTDAYRAKYRMFGENLSLGRQLLYTNAIWNDLGYRDATPDPGFAAWLETRPAATLTWFARGKYDRALVTLRDRGRVIGLPLIGGGPEQHRNSPYFPVPFSPGMLAGVPDGTWPNLVPRFRLADGTTLMPLAWYENVAMRRDGARTTVTYRQNALDRVDGDDPVADPRLSVETEYLFAPGTIRRRDHYVPRGAVAIAGIDLDFGSFSSEAAVAGSAVRFARGDVTGFTVTGVGDCTAVPTAGAPDYRTPIGPFASIVRCARGPATLAVPFTIEWTLRYR